MKSSVNQRSYQNYKVMVEGANWRVRSSVVGSGPSIEKLGFFATRCILARTADEAKHAVLEQVKREIHAKTIIFNDAFDPPTVIVDQVDLAADNETSADGFTFFPDV